MSAITPESRGEALSEPNYSEWPAILAENLENRVLNKALRGPLISAAHAYSQKLKALAESVGVDLDLPAEVSAERTIVMAGHQPRIYHHGLLQKNEALQKLCVQTSSLGINLLIDLDESDAGYFKFPIFDRETLHVSSATLSCRTGLIRSQRLIGADKQKEIWVELLGQLPKTGAKVDLNSLREASRVYAALPCHSIAEANSIARSLFEPRRNYLELPLSDLVKLKEAQAILIEWCQKGESLHHGYNQMLAEHRAANKIKGSVNPFPDLEAHSGKFELPFWLIDEEQSLRFKVFTDKSNFYSSSDQQNFTLLNPSDHTQQRYLSPKAALLSIFYRGFCSDLFIHGLGGKTYDTFSDRLAPKLFGIDLPKFVVTTRDHFLFPEQVLKASDWEKLEQDKKQLISHPELCLENSNFSSQEKEQILAIVPRRSELIQQLERVSSPAEKVPIGKELKGIGDKIRTIIEGLLARTKPYPDSNTREAWFTRDYPVFF